MSLDPNSIVRSISNIRDRVSMFVRAIGGHIVRRRVTNRLIGFVSDEDACSATNWPPRYRADRGLLERVPRWTVGELRFATEPTGVRLPAKVALIARRLRWLSETSTQQPVLGQTQKVGIAPRWLGDRRLKPATEWDGTSRLGGPRWRAPTPPALSTNNLREKNGD
jgi:hypothetical protein